METQSWPKQGDWGVDAGVKATMPPRRQSGDAYKAAGRNDRAHYGALIADL